MSMADVALPRLFLIAALGCGLSQSTPSAGRQQPAESPVFKAESELVVMHVSVRDRRGRYVTGLDQGAFTVIDDGQAQSLAMFSADEVPASIAFLIDNSDSMRPNRERVIAASVAFAAGSHPQDEISVLTFNEAVSPAFGPALIADIPEGSLRAALDRAITARGMTAAYDGILAGLRRVARGAHTRQVLILVSDGDDNASRAAREETLKLVRESDATVYTVILIDPLLGGGNPGLMRRLAKDTGGEAFEPRTVSDIPDVFARIAKDIRSAYTLAYAPTHRGGEGARRRAVRVYARSGDGRALSVRARDGYVERRPEGREQ
jgi:Ca-activated chloride channel homolog